MGIVKPLRVAACEKAHAIYPMTESAMKATTLAIIHLERNKDFWIDCERNPGGATYPFSQLNQSDESVASML